MMIGGTATAWIFLAFIAKALKFTWLAFASFGLGCISLICFLCIIFFLQKQFGTKGDLDYTQRVIEDELRRRVGRMPHRPRPKQ